MKQSKAFKFQTTIYFVAIIILQDFGSQLTVHLVKLISQTRAKAQKKRKLFILITFIAKVGFRLQQVRIYVLFSDKWHLCETNIFYHFDHLFEIQKCVCTSMCECGLRMYSILDIMRYSNELDQFIIKPQFLLQKFYFRHKFIELMRKWTVSCCLLVLSHLIKCFGPLSYVACYIFIKLCMLYIAGKYANI